MVEEGVQHKHCREPVPPRGGTLPLGSAMSSIAACLMSGLTPQAAGTADIGGRFKSACWRTSVPRRSQNGHYGISAPDHSALAPANLITLAHFSVSSAINIPKSAGERTNTVAPRSANRAFRLGSARPALISLFNLLTISAGVSL